LGRSTGTRRGWTINVITQIIRGKKYKNGGREEKVRTQSQKEANDRLWEVKGRKCEYETKSPFENRCRCFGQDEGWGAFGPDDPTTCL